jgi:hypothetical protein
MRNRVLLLVLWPLVAAPAPAQERTGRITGRVTDPAGLPAGGVRIRAVHTGTGYTRQGFSTEPDGLYLIPALPPGRYRLEASRDGFAPLIREGIAVDVDQPARADLQLSLAAAAESGPAAGDALQVNIRNATGHALSDRKPVAARQQLSSRETPGRAPNRFFRERNRRVFRRPVRCLPQMG